MEGEDDAEVTALTTRSRRRQGVATGGKSGGMPRLYAATKSFRHRVSETLYETVARQRAAEEAARLRPNHTSLHGMSTAATAISAARSMMRSGGVAGGSGRGVPTGGTPGAVSRPQSLPNLQLPWSMAPVPKTMTPHRFPGSAQPLLPPVGSP
eukprot:SAG22_NODE_1899_length_3345_cov_1.439310_2_plen_153_part_00